MLSFLNAMSYKCGIGLELKIFQYSLRIFYLFVACYATYKALCRSVGPSVRHAIDFSAFASGFRITAPAQSHETDVVVYTGPPAAPAPHITAPAQPHATMPVRVSGLVFWIEQKM